jgi:pimeloyl-ACP methyl ester carboxylesterase
MALLSHSLFLDPGNSFIQTAITHPHSYVDGKFFDALILRRRHRWSRQDNSDLLFLMQPLTVEASMRRYESGETTIHLISPARPEALADVIFIHGLNGHAETTWMHNENDNESFWPLWLAQDLPETCVWSAEYPAAPAKWLGSGKSIPLQTVVIALLDRLEQLKLGNRPIVLICHSLGGLVAKQMIRAAAERTVSETWRKIGLAVKGVMFISTPHAGAPLANFLVTMAGLLLPSRIGRSSASLEDLQANSIVLSQLSDWYREAAHTDGIATQAYYEEELTNGVMVVPLDTGNPKLLKVTPIPLPFNHWQTSKPRSRSSQVYMGAVQFVQKVIINGPPTQKGLGLSLISPPDGKCTIPCARDKRADLKTVLEEAILASRLPSDEWIGKTLARYKKLAKEAVKADPDMGYTLHHGVDVTESEEFALAAIEWRRATGMNIQFRHDRETIAARTVVIGLEVANTGPVPANRIELELQISSRHRISTTPKTGFSASIRTTLPIPPETLDVTVASPDLEALREIDNRKWYNSQSRPQEYSRSNKQVFLFEENRTGDVGPWMFRSAYFDLRQGRSIQMAPLYVCFEYDPAYDLEISYQLSAENLPGIANGKLSVSIADEA